MFVIVCLLLNLYFVVLTQLKDVLHKQATVEAFTEWLDATLNQKVVKASNIVLLMEVIRNNPLC